MVLKKCNHPSLWKKCMCKVRVENLPDRYKPKDKRIKKICNMDGHYTFRECGER